MPKLEPYSEIEDALMRLMPVGMGQAAHSELESQLDELCGDADFEGGDVGMPKVLRFPKWIAASGIAAALLLGFVLFPKGAKVGGDVVSPASVGADEAPSVVLLTEVERVEQLSDEGLFVDSGGSAVRKFRRQVVGESKLLDKESGIEVTLSEPREEIYLVPVSTF